MTTEMTKGPGAGTMTQADHLRTARFVPACDITESADEYVVLAEMPGCDPAGIDLHFDGGVLSIYGKVAPRQGETAYLAKEFEVGDFSRTFNVTDSIDSARISAEYADGILTLRLPKAEAAKPRKIEVRTK
jgi:HSP20 family protein